MQDCGIDKILKNKSANSYFNVVECLILIFCSDFIPYLFIHYFVLFLNQFVTLCDTNKVVYFPDYRCRSFYDLFVVCLHVIVFLHTKLKKVFMTLNLNLLLIYLVLLFGLFFY